MRQQIRPQAEREMPEWQREALDWERSRPRSINDVLDAVERLDRRFSELQARLHMIEQYLAPLREGK